jgi:hypothetical protein
MMSGETQTNFQPGDAVLVNHEGKPAGAKVEAVEKSGKVDARITDYGHPKHGAIMKFAPEDVQPMPEDYVPPEIPKAKPAASPMAAGPAGNPNAVPAKRVRNFEDLGADKNSISYWKADDGTWWLYLPGVGKANCMKHDAKEDADGKLTLTPSVLVTGGNAHRHGYLTHGVWNPCGDDQPPAPVPAEPEMPAAPSADDWKPQAFADLQTKIEFYAADIKNFVKAYYSQLESRIESLELQVESHGKELDEANARITALEQAANRSADEATERVMQTPGTPNRETLRIALQPSGADAAQEAPKKKDEGDAEQFS